MSNNIKSLDDLLIINDLHTVSKAIGIAEITLRREIRRGKIKVFRMNKNGKIYIRREEIKRYIADNES